MNYRMLTVVVFAVLIAGNKAPALARDSANCLKDEKTFAKYWTTDGKRRIEAKGVHLVGDATLISKFEAGRNFTMIVTFESKQRNLLVEICGEPIAIKTPLAKGKEVTVVEVVRKGDLVHYNYRVNNRRVTSDGFRIPKDGAKEAGQIKVSSRKVHGANGLKEHNAYQDVFLKSLAINGSIKFDK